MSTHVVCQDCSVLFHHVTFIPTHTYFCSCLFSHFFFETPSVMQLIFVAHLALVITVLPFIVIGKMRRFYEVNYLNNFFWIVLIFILAFRLINNVYFLAFGLYFYCRRLKGIWCCSTENVVLHPCCAYKFYLIFKLRICNYWYRTTYLFSVN